jgi:hypothetical protein
MRNQNKKKELARYRNKPPRKEWKTKFWKKENIWRKKKKSGTYPYPSSRVFHILLGKHTNTFVLVVNNWKA